MRSGWRNLDKPTGFCEAKEGCRPGQWEKQPGHRRPGPRAIGL